MKRGDSKSKENRLLQNEVFANQFLTSMKYSNAFGGIFSASFESVYKDDRPGKNTRRCTIVNNCEGANCLMCPVK
jgi:hypothetical protein